MDTNAATMAPSPALFQPSPYFDDPINGNIIQSEIEGGVDLRILPTGVVLSIETRNRSYTVVHLGDEGALISGHPEFCPDPILVRINGSTWGGTMIKTKFLGRGMHMEFEHPVCRTIITSPIVDIRTQ